MTSLKRSQSERVYSRQRSDIITDAEAKCDQWQNAKQAWPVDEVKEKSETREQARKNFIRRFLSYLIKRLWFKRKRRLVDLNEEDIVQDLCRFETEEENSDESIYYSVSSTMENSALKKELKLKNDEIESLRLEVNEVDSLRQRVRELEEERKLHYTTNKGGLIISEPKYVNIHNYIGEDKKPSNTLEE